MKERYSRLTRYQYDLVVDNVCFLMSLCGNDFIPNIPFMDMYNNFIYYLCDILGQVLSETNEFIIKENSVNFKLLQLLFQKISQIEETYYFQNPLRYVNSLIDFAQWKFTSTSEEEKKERYAAIIGAKERLPKDFALFKKYYYEVKLDIDSSSSVESCGLMNRRIRDGNDLYRVLPRVNMGLSLLPRGYSFMDMEISVPLRPIC